ncbi:secreted effector protein SseB [Paraburkholderia sp. Clong3]|uniref:hypothetical protein n=1 Tax=Paraburkholderia sp. Clong3 TaxID=2991061 RepID=UPI003D245C47
MCVKRTADPDHESGDDGRSIGPPSAPTDYGDWNLLEFAQEIMMYDVLTMQQLAAKKLAQILANSKLARDAQEKANLVDECLSRYTGQDPNDTKDLPTEVRKFMQENGILVDGKAIPDTGNVTRGEMQAIKAAIDNFVSRQTDISQQANLEIQKITTTYNYLIEATKTLISKAADLNQGIYNKL